MNAEFKPRAPSTFSGSPTEDVNAWLFRVKQYCKLLAVPETNYALFASTYLEGNAIAWWRAHVEDAEANLVTAITTWDEFQTALSRQFTIVNASDAARDRLLILRQTSSVEEYVREFRNTIVHIVPKLTVEDQIHRFGAGLKFHIGAEVRLRRPTTLNDAIVIATTYDYLGHSRPQFYDPNPTSSSSHVGPTPKSNPMEVDAIRLAPLTVQERDALRRANACFRCRKPGHYANQCTRNRQQSGKVPPQ